mmetsp:Transcript_7396/g.10784  ORF Transcript_7396/g.10784 Transcript_7396/m.10784 type:complete len:224 (-) Transcript_7396:707-1378(-)
MTFKHQRRGSAFTPIKSSKKRFTLKKFVCVHEFEAQPMTKEEKAELYYTKDELKMINLEVGAIFALSNQLSQTQQTTCRTDNQDNNKSSNCVLAIEADAILRGLEFCIYPQRFQNKLVARRALLKYQSHLQTKYPNISPEEKAKAMKTASKKLSAWPKLVALETARLDSRRAYDAEYLIPLDDSPVKFSSLPALAKRRVSFKEVRRVAFEDVPRHPFKRARAA